MKNNKDEMPVQWDPRKLKSPSRNLLKLELGGFGGGVHFEIPFHALVGKVRKPQVLLIAGVHGDEYEGVAALQDVAQEIDPRNLTGTVIIVPVANPQAFYVGTRRNPVDGGDLNRSFPGDTNGTMCERLAHLVFQNLVLGSDAVLSMHCWSREATVIPYVEYPAGRTKAKLRSFSIARNLGVEFLHPYDWHPGLLVASAVNRGIPSVEAEVGGMGTVTKSGQRISYSIIHSFLSHLKLVDTCIAPAEPSDANSKIIGHADCLSSHAGLFRSCVNAGDSVERVQLVGTIHDLAGRCLEEVWSPERGKVAILRTFASVQPGDLLIQVFEEV